MRGSEIRASRVRAASAGVVAAFALLLAMSVTGATRTDLDQEWEFRADPESQGTASGWNSAIPPETEAVTVPHTWNIGRLHDYHGVAWYFRKFVEPSHSVTGHVELHFGATFYSARVWLNGVELGAHEGGYTAYSFDITHRLRSTNVLAVRLDNRAGMATIPGIAARGGPNASYDWWAYGGLVRDVWLTTTGPVWVHRQEIRTVQGAGGAVVHDRILLLSEPVGGEPVRQAGITVHVTAFGPDNRAEADEVRTISLARGSAELNVPLNLPHPKLWSIDHPDIYRMVVEVRDRNDQLLDEDTATFGVRTLEIRDRHLLINGERVRLTGVTRHEDSPWEGLAETRGTIQQDYADMKALHTTLTRPVHYPQNPLVLDYADRHGIVLIPEIPVWQFSEAQLADPRVQELARQQLREMIEQAGNHPSILGWSVANESATGTPGGIAYFRAMREFIRSIDPGRPVSFADDNLPKLQRPEQSAANDADFLMMNQYFGSWHGPAEALEPALERIHRLFPDKMVIISEMGFAGIFAHDAVEADQARIRTMRQQMPVLAARDWIGGAILWCYQDYKSPRNLWPGQAEGYVEHGLVDESRQRKPSYGVWKELNRPARLVAHWVGPAEQPPAGFDLAVTPNTERDLPFYPLHGYRLTWAVLDAKGNAVVNGDRQLGELTTPVNITGSLSAGAPAETRDSTGSPAGLSAPAAPDDRRPTYQLTVTLVSPTGSVAASEMLEWRQPIRASQEK